MTQYVFKRIVNYLISAVVLICLYVVLMFLIGWQPGGLLQSVMIALIIFAYPVYRLIRGTAIMIADYYDEDCQVDVNLFGHICELLLPSVLKKDRKSVFRLNLISKLLQGIFIGILVYAFLSGEYGLLRAAVAVAVIMFGIAMYVLIRVPVKVHQRQKQAQTDELVSMRSAMAYPPDPDREAAFMVLPKRLLLADVLVLVSGALVIVFLPNVGIAVIQLLLQVLKTAGFAALLLLPFAIYYYNDQRHVSFSYTLDKGKGEYGQLKVEYYEYEGWGDDRDKVRNKIDRIESIDIGARYIKVLKSAEILPVKIPRTFKNEKDLLEALQIMMK